MRIIEVNKSCQTLTIGRTGEYGASDVRIPLDNLIKEHGEGRAELVFCPPYTSDIFICSAERDGNTLVWHVGAAETKTKGHAKAEVRWYKDGVLAKSELYSVTIVEALHGPITDAPEPVKDWIDIASGTLEAFENDILKIENHEKRIRFLEQYGGGSGGENIYIENPYDDKWARDEFVTVNEKLENLENQVGNVPLILANI